MQAHASGQHVQVAIIGSGFGGLGAAIRLKRAGIDDFIIFERAAEVGGVWRDNQYPGAACDVEAHLYSFSFAPNPAWTRRYAQQAEIWAYLQRCAHDFAILPHIRFGHEVREAAWDADQWRISTSQGDWTATTLVMAAGSLAEPSMPALPGIERFTGPVFHSARWDTSFDLNQRNVAVIGTGASAIQLVPAIQPLVARLMLFQRTPAWVIPRYDRAISPRRQWIFGHVPLARLAVRAGIYSISELGGIAFRKPKLMKYVQQFAQRHMEDAISDPALRAKLTPSYTIGCKRILTSDDYYPALSRANVEVITAGIAEIGEHAIIDAAGDAHPTDAIILATGFHVTDSPFARHVRGRDGHTLHETWAGSPKAHLGTTVAGFPNLFLIQGPNTGLSHTSVILMQEAQIEHLIGALRHMRRHAIAALEPRPEAQAAFVAEVDRRMAGTVWTTGGCTSWYLDATVRNSTIWPGSPGEFRRRVARFRPQEYRLWR